MKSIPAIYLTHLPQAFKDGKWTYKDEQWPILIMAKHGVWRMVRRSDAHRPMPFVAHKKRSFPPTHPQPAK